MCSNDSKASHECCTRLLYEIFISERQLTAGSAAAIPSVTARTSCAMDNDEHKFLVVLEFSKAENVTVVTNKISITIATLVCQL